MMRTDEVFISGKASSVGTDIVPVDGRSVSLRGGAAVADNDSVHGGGSHFFQDLTAYSQTHFKTVRIFFLVVFFPCPCEFGP